MAGPVSSIDVTTKALYRRPDGRATKRTMARQINSLQRELDMESMNGEAIMACRDYIQKTLNVNAVTIPGLNVASPFFDDLVMAIVNKLVQYQRTIMALAQQQQATAQTQSVPMWVTTNNAVNTATAATSAYGSMIQSTLVNTTPAYSSLVGQQMPQVWPTPPGYPPSPVVHDDGSIAYRPQDGKLCRIDLPDGAKINIRADGGYTIEDKQAKVVYRANRVREFNRYINASDLLEEFIRFAGAEGVRQGEFMRLPLKLFVAWLIVRAAEADGEPSPAPALADLRKPHCVACGRFISPLRVAKRVEVCGPVCLGRIAA